MLRDVNAFSHFLLDFDSAVRLLYFHPLQDTPRIGLGYVQVYGKSSTVSRVE